MTISDQEHQSRQTKVVLEATQRIQRIMDGLKDKVKKEPPFMTQK